MRHTGRWRLRSGAAAVSVALIAGLTGLAVPAAATTTGGVSHIAVNGTPQLVKLGTNVVSVVRQLTECDGVMYAVGDFGEINQGSSNYTRNNIFSFQATAPYTVTSWAPDVNGRINSIAFNGTDCGHAYIGGNFTSVNGTAVKNIAEIDTSTGDVVPGFGSQANDEVFTILPYQGHLLTGGFFTKINGSTADPYFASLSPATGSDDGFLHLNVHGTYHYCTPGGSKCTSPDNRSEIYSQQLSHGGTLDLVEGRFTSVGGLPRQQIFMLNLATDPATVTGWTSPEWDGSQGNLPNGYPYQCWPSEAFYIRAAAWSPDDQTVYIATTGYHPANMSTSVARAGLCDAAAAFPATQTSVLHKWVEYTGCDSYYTVAADNAAVYAAGHPRWADNPNGCDKAGPGAVTDYGLHGLDPATGQVELNSSGGPLYTMTRANAGFMMITSAGLWIGSTNRYTVNKCGDKTGPTGDNAAGHAGICLLPYSP